MVIDTRTPEGRARETRNASLFILRKRLKEALIELDFLISATETGDRRNTFCDANIHILEAQKYLESLQSEESPPYDGSCDSTL